MKLCPQYEPDNSAALKPGARVQLKSNGALGVIEFSGNSLVVKSFITEPDNEAAFLVKSSITPSTLDSDKDLPVIEPDPYPVTLGTYEKKKNTYWRISYRDGSRVKHHHVTSGKVNEIRNAIAAKKPRSEIIAMLTSK